MSPSTDPIAGLACQVMVSSPPYNTTSPFDDSSPAERSCSGEIVVCQSSNTLVALAQLTASIHRWPWLVPCIAISHEQGPLEPLLLLVSELRDRLAVVKGLAPTLAAAPSDVVAAARSRKPPNAEVLANWVGYRLKSRELRDALASQFGHALGGPRASAIASAATFSRLFGRYGNLTARDWRAIALLCVQCARRDREPVGLPLRTARDYVHKYLRLPYHTLADRIGWEWVLEGALRVGRYVDYPQ